MSLSVTRCLVCRYSVPTFVWAGSFRLVPHRRDGKACPGGYDVARNDVRRAAGSADYGPEDVVRVPFLDSEENADVR